MRLCLTDQVFDGRVRIHNLKRRGLLAVQRGNKLLADDRLKHHGELHAHLRLLPGREHIDDAVHRVGSACGVQRAEQQLPRLRGGHGHLDGLIVPHFAQQDDVRALPQSTAKGADIARRIS